MSPDADGGLRQLMPASGTAAFQRALRYALAAAGRVTPEMLARPTPCRAWDLRMLLLHATESLAALAEGLDDRRVLLHPAVAGAGLPIDPGALFRLRARRLLGSCARADPADAVITVGGCPMAATLLVTTGALEVAVHGWDIAQACGSREPVPAALAAGLLRAAPLLITDSDRQRLFAAPVHLAAGASPSDRLIAFLGRPTLWSSLTAGGT
jgi:uncharacterized protein (TIGR03086 family)